MKTGEKTIHLTIDREWCKGCGLCIDSCPKHLLDVSEDFNASGFHYAVLTGSESCTGCSQCALMCPDMAIQIWIRE